MTISYPLSAPTAAESSESTMTLFGRNGIAFGESVFSLKQYVHDFDSDAWGLIISIDSLDRALAQEWAGLITALRGKFGTFLWGPAILSTPLGAGGGAPKVNGAGQTGRSLAVDGFPNSTLVLKKGDLFSISNRLYENLTDATTNGSGQVTLDIWPRLRTSPADNADLTLTNPKGTWRIVSNEQLVYEGTATKLFPYTITAQEAL